MSDCRGRNVPEIAAQLRSPNEVFTVGRTDRPPAHSVNRRAAEQSRVWSGPNEPENGDGQTGERGKERERLYKESQRVLLLPHF